MLANLNHWKLPSLTYLSFNFELKTPIFPLITRSDTQSHHTDMADDSGVRFILDAIACGEELKMDFKPVATYHGISLAGNAYVNPYSLIL